MTTTPHGQVPEALIDLIDAYAETRHRCGGIYNARTEAARNAVIEALSGVQALSAAPAEQQAAPKAAPGEPDGFGSAEHWKEKAQYWAGVAHRLRGEALRGEPVDGIVHPPAPQQEAQEPVAYVHVPHFTVEGKVRPVVSFEKYQQDYADGIYSTRIPLYTAPKAAPGEQNTVPAELLEQAYREGWAACRDAETIGEEAEDWAFGNSTANSRMIDAQQAAPQQEAQESVAWESTTPGYIKYITQTRYEKFSPAVRRWYKPYRCSGCAERGAVFDACDMATAAPQPAPDCHHRPPCDECAAIAAQRGNK